MKLTPVIEFGPELFRKEHRDYPSFELERKAFRKAYREFWYEMLADWNITDLKPYREGSQFVALSDISKETLGVLIDRELEDGGFTDGVNEDHVSVFCGGLIFESGLDVIEPTCCGDLSNFFEWEDLAIRPVGEVTQVWIGHPWLNNDKMRLFMENEDSSDVLVDLSISQAELLKHVKRVGRELVVFKDRVKADLIRKSYPPKLAHTLTGIDENYGKEEAAPAPS